MGDFVIVGRARRFFTVSLFLLSLSGCALAAEGPSSVSVPLAERTECAQEEWVHFPVFVGFAPDEVELPADDTLVFDVVAALESRPDASMVRVEGHHDDCSNEPADGLLAEARAQSVARALVEMGVEPERIEAVGYGRAARTCCSGPGDPNRDARVEFSFLLCTPPP